MCDCIAPCTCSQCCVAPPGRRGPPGPPGSGAFVTAYAGVSSLSAGTMSFVNSNGVSFGINGQTITGSVAAGLSSQSNQAFSGSNGSFTFQTASFGNLNGVSFYSSNGSLVASVAAATQSNPGFSASGGSSAFQTLNFANSNGITFSNQGGSVVASFNALTSQSNPAFSASGGSSAFQTLNFANSNGLTFSNSNGSVVASYTVPTVIAPVTVSSTVFAQQMAGAIAATALGQNSVIIYPEVFGNYVSGGAFKIPVSISFASIASTSCQNGYTLDVGLYTRNATNSTILSRHYSTSYTLAGSFSSNVSCAWSAITGFNNSTSYVSISNSSAGVANSESIHGRREFIMPMSSLFNPGEYWVAFRNSTSVGGAGTVLQISLSRVGTVDVYPLGVTINTTGPGLAQNIGAGIYSATTGALPAAISMSEIYNAPSAIKAYILSTTA